MPHDTICCSGARLTGTILSGRGQGGAVWTVDLTRVAQAVYSERRGLSHLRCALLLCDPDGWQRVEITVPRRCLTQSRDLMEHRALCAAVAERLDALSPGFCIDYRVSGLLNWSRLHRRPPGISASALPGILTAAARRQG